MSPDGADVVRVKRGGDRMTSLLETGKGVVWFVGWFVGWFA